MGMDFTEVNFELTSGQQRHNDEATFRELFEFICHQVNQPVKNVDHGLPMQDVVTMMRNNRF
jgi:predicted membrane GTPase involved in stress response